MTGIKIMLYICDMRPYRISRTVLETVVAIAAIFPLCCCSDRGSFSKKKACDTLLAAEEKRKAHIAFEDTAAIEEAIRYFRSDGDRVHEVEARYYSGLAAFNAGRTHKAVKEALTAIDLIGRNGNALFKARAHELLADAYRSVFNLKVARIHRRNAAETYENSGYRKNAFYATMDLASEFSHEDNDSAHILMKKALSLTSDDNMEMAHYNFLYADICRVRGEYAKALGHFRAIGSDLRKDMMNSADSVHIGEIYYRNAMPDSAHAYFNTPEAQNDIQYWECMADMHERDKNYNLALEAGKHIRDLEYDKAGTSLSNSLEFVERTFYERKARDAREKHRRLLIVTTVCAGILVLALLAALLFRYYRKSKALKAENEIKDVALIAGAQHVMPETDKPTPGEENDNDRWANVILDFYMQKLNQISREYFKVTDETELHDIEDEFNRELRSLRSGDIFDEIEKRLNERNDGIATKIRRQFPKFNEQYVRLMLCSLAGLSSQSICLLLSIGKGNYYMMWTRIRARIRASEVPDKALFERLFLKRSGTPA